MSWDHLADFGAVSQDRVTACALRRGWPQIIINLPAVIVVAAAHGLVELLVYLAVLLMSFSPYLRYELINAPVVQTLEPLGVQLVEHLEIDRVVAVQRLQVPVPVALESILPLPVYPVDFLAVGHVRRDELLDLDLEREVHALQTIVQLFGLGGLHPEMADLIDVLHGGGDEKVGAREVQELTRRLTLLLFNEYKLGQA